jgi:hypothetical protein
MEIIDLTLPTSPSLPLPPLSSLKRPREEYVGESDQPSFADQPRESDQPSLKQTKLNADGDVKPDATPVAAAPAPTPLMIPLKVVVSVNPESLSPMPLSQEFKLVIGTENLNPAAIEEVEVSIGWVSGSTKETILEELCIGPILCGLSETPLKFSPPSNSDSVSQSVNFLFVTCRFQGHCFYNINKRIVVVENSVENSAEHSMDASSSSAKDAPLTQVAKPDPQEQVKEETEEAEEAEVTTSEEDEMLMRNNDAVPMPLDPINLTYRFVGDHYVTTFDIPGWFPQNNDDSINPLLSRLTCLGRNPRPASSSTPLTAPSSAPPSTSPSASPSTSPSAPSSALPTARDVIVLD